METFRADLLLFVDRLATYEPLVADPAGFAARLDALRQQVHAIPTDQLHHLKSGFERNAPIWQRALAGQSADRPESLGRKGLDLTIDFEGIDCSFGCGSACDLDCGKCCDPGPPLCNPVCLACEGTEEICKLGCEAAELVCGGLNDAISEVVGVINQITGFLDDFFEDIEGVFTEIAGLPGDIEEFFLGIFSDLECHLLSIVSTLAGPVDELLAVSSPADALSLLGLDGLDASFFEDLAESVPTLDLPCPAMDTEIPGIGTVGSARAEYACRRGIDWVAHLIYDVVPDDVFAVPVKVPATFVYQPIHYFCLCMEAQSALSFHGAQDDHRDHVAANLDARLGTRASQASADLLTATLAAVSSDVSGLAADTSNRQGAIDALDGDVARIEGTVDGLQSDAESIDASQDEQSAFTEAFRDLVLRLRIQENLLASPNRAVALFQLPEAHGGYLETVREVVAEALLRSSEAGFDSRTAQRELARGDQALGSQDYETAYDHYSKAYRDAVKN
jgi:hypothetical protein